MPFLVPTFGAVTTITPPTWLCAAVYPRFTVGKSLAKEVPKSAFLCLSVQTCCEPSEANFTLILQAFREVLQDSVRADFPL
jgi:hypothetical protein